MPSPGASLPRLTAIRRARPGRVALQVDGRPWRVVPDDVLVRSGLAVGVELDRATLRRFRQELRRAEALATAGRALARRDLSLAGVEDRLSRARVAPPARAAAVAALERAGIVDDERFARGRALSLAERGWGDAAIAARLEAEGVAAGQVAAGLDELPDEGTRAVQLVTGLERRKAWALLARRGFGEEAIERAIGLLDE